MSEEKSQPTPRNWWSFASLAAMQTQNAFNDNVAKFVLMPLGAWLAARGLGPEGGLEHLLAILLILPYVLFAPTAGWLSDRFSKNLVIRYAAWFQLLVLAFLAFALWRKSLPLSLVAFFLLAVQSAFLAPAKLGVVKELIGSNKVALGSGILSGTVVVAILAGQIGGGFWFDHGLSRQPDGWRAAGMAVNLIGIGALISLALAHGIQKTRPMSRDPYTLGRAFSHFKDLATIWQDLSLKRSALGASFFWGFGGFAQLVIFQIAREAYEGEQGTGTYTSVMLVALVVGISLGCFVAGSLSRGRIVMGFAPLGGLLLTIGMVLAGMTVGGGGWFYFGLGLAGFGGAFFLVPLQAFLMDHPPEEMRGKVLAASNLLNMLSSIVAVALQKVLQVGGVPPSVQLVSMSATVLVATYFVMRLLPPEFVRSFILGTVRRIYRIEVFHRERMPPTGGVLVVPNHVSFVDVMILSVAAPRHLRFLMVRTFFATPLVGSVARMFETIPISSTRAKDALRAAAGAASDGAAVCIFPEGTLTHSGMLNEIKSGYSIIARKAGCPVLPVYVDGLWGSIFSAERERYFWKRPREFPLGVRVSFGEVLPPDADAVTLRAHLNREAGFTMVRRHEVTGSLSQLLGRVAAAEQALRWWSGGEFHGCTWRDVAKVVDGIREPGHLAPEHGGARKWLQGWRELADKEPGELQALVLNALQVLDCGDLATGWFPVAIHPEVDPVVWHVWGLLMPVLTKTEAVVLAENETRETLAAVDNSISLRAIAGGKQLERILRAEENRFSQWRIHSFDGRTQEAPGRGLKCYRGLVHAGRIVATSIPHPPRMAEGNKNQVGWQAGSCGRMLAGIAVTPNDDGLQLESPLWDRPMSLPGHDSGADGFVVPRSPS